MVHASRGSENTLAHRALGNPQGKGHCGDVLKDSKQANIVLIPVAPHTLMNLPFAARPQCHARVCLRPAQTLKSPAHLPRARFGGGRYSESG